MAIKAATFFISLAYPIELMPDSDVVSAVVESILWAAAARLK
jgi:hypothetical protein